MNKITITISSGSQYNSTYDVLFYMNMIYTVCTQLAYFRQELPMNLGWEILLDLPKKSEAGEK